MDAKSEIYDLSNKLARLKARKKRPETQIYYVQKKLERLKSNKPSQNERKTLPQKPSVKNNRQPLYSPASSANRAYVLSRETHDLIQAILALEKLRKV